MKISNSITRRFIALLCAVALWTAPAAAQTAQPESAQPDYLNPRLPVEQRVNDLVRRMTLEEKVSQMMNKSAAIERLGVPLYDWWNEALHGVAYAGVATVFPQAIGLGATWNPDLIQKVATVISDEARAKYNDAIKRDSRKRFYGLTFWSPNINIFRDPRWGRGQETYGEDPYLTSRLGVAFVKGMQGDDPRYLKVIATPKHYAVHSGPESERHTFNAKPSARDMEETYLAAFRQTIVEGKAGSVMCAYNSVDGVPVCASKEMMTGILRDDWNFDGYVVSDCDAVADIYKNHKFAKTEEEGVALAVKAGTDLTCGYEYKALIPAVKQGLISEAEIDKSVKRLFAARFRLGMFDPPEMVGYSRIPFEVNDSPANRAMALRAARESIVLLKNENNILPLKKDVGKIAVIGANADSLEALLGNYNGVPSKWVTPLEGIRRKVSSQTKVLDALGTTLTDEYVVPVPSSALFTPDDRRTPGLRGEYFDNKDLQGAPVITRIDRQVNFNWFTESPVPPLPTDNFSVRWTGKLIPDVSGTYQLGASADDGVRVYLDDKILVEDWRDRGAKTVTKPVALEAGREYKIRIEYFDRYAAAVARLVWSPPRFAQTLREEAIRKAKESDVVVMVLGLSPSLEGEEMEVKTEGFRGGDRTDLNLPKVQQELLEAVHATGKPVVLVLLNGSALSINWANDHVAAIVEAWYPGEEGGTALADVLFGDYNPGGRLPVTFYKSLANLPPFNDYNMQGKTYRYFSGDPLYPFGYGLSYTKFKYGNLSFKSKRVTPNENVEIAVDVQNVGDRGGDEVVQLYVTDVAASAPVALRSLRGIQRIYLKPNEKRRISFTLTPRDLTMVDDNGKRILEPGDFRVSIGGKQPGFAGYADAPTTGVLIDNFVMTGKPTEISAK
ncbi:MAG: glycoside hydrolase family 3 C-terminal domain-containing protein [Pyrinomonadaceae bacterium MAG19_C2-C3]|nr:glycoside hydrolase family 3 C-terminal domain-containing protein [Pyrinomonadaceae bacterium MAG19_C2-C3]